MLQDVGDQGRDAAPVRIANASLVRSAVFVLVVLSFVVTGLLMPVPIRGPKASPLADLAHAPIFATLALVVLLTGSQLSRKKTAHPEKGFRALLVATWKLVLSVVVALSFFGIAMEYVQRYFGRRGSWSDVLLNSVGLAAGICLFWAFASRQRERLGGSFLVLLSLGCCFLAAASAMPAYELWLIYSEQSR